ncbi:hypothetical protein NDU88_004552 [Pleurodeles waltl]|uniref:CCHC-type domain-containing protein n=1 Tax=Pleurodeles waltl TaxID=8319 RepID=A0AAV7W7T7_PLEWA|nr:hypothetical protein NDU88_004552 [Pleurodeles waltl]
MSDQGISAPPPFLATPGDPPIPWKHWKKIFNTYMLAIGSDRYAPPRRQAILLHHLGIEGRRIYETLPEVSLGMGDGQPTNIFDMSMQMLDEQFIPKTNLVLQRHKFFSRVQQEDEDIASYVASLRGLALSCEFHQLLDSLIRDQIVRCAHDRRIREKLLVKDPNLEEAIRIAKGMEHAAVWLREMEKVPNEGEPGIITEVRKKHDPHIKVEWGKTTKNFEATKVDAEEKRKAQEWRVIKCYRCDAPGHIASSKTCAARNAICRSCGKRGHFAKTANEGKTRHERVSVVLIMAVTRKKKKNQQSPSWKDRLNISSRSHVSFVRCVADGRLTATLEEPWLESCCL